MKNLPDGVYIGLDDETYFGQDRLGSTDLKLLHDDPASWWYSSRLNPNRVERERSDEMDFGSALHALVLEGEGAYTKRCAIRPDTYFDVKSGEQKKWHGGAAFCKEWAEANDRPGGIILTEDADRRVRHMAELILNHPELGEPMRAGLSEVAVLTTTIDGVKLRAKFDKMLPKFTVDLKTFGGDAWGYTVKAQCLNLVKQRAMDIQRYAYAIARMRMSDLIADGHLYGGNDHEREWITKAAAVEEPDWCWLFYRRRDDKRPYAPVVKPIIRPHNDITFDTGRRKTEVAIQNYLTFKNRFGSVPWAIIEPSEEPDDTEFPPGITDVREPVQLPDLEEQAA